MTRRADHIIDMLKVEIARGRALAPISVGAALRTAGLRQSEAGWVLHHVFGIPMPEAVHLASGPVTPAHALTVVTRGAFLPVRDQPGPHHYTGA